MIELSLENYESGHLRKKEVEYVAQRPKIDIKNANGLNEFSAVPRSLFAADGTMFHCTKKSLLMSTLKDLLRNQPVNITSIQDTSDDGSGSQAAVRMRADIVDGMAEVQSMKKTMILSTVQI